MWWGRAGFQTAGVELPRQEINLSCLRRVVVWCWDVILFETVCYLFLPSRGSRESPRSLLTDANAGRATELSLQTPPLHQGVELSQGWRPPQKGFFPREKAVPLPPIQPAGTAGFKSLGGYVSSPGLPEQITINRVARNSHIDPLPALEARRLESRYGQSWLPSEAPACSGLSPRSWYCWRCSVLPGLWTCHPPPPSHPLPSLSAAPSLRRTLVIGFRAPHSTNPGDLISGSLP